MSLAALYDVPAPAKINLFLHVVGRRADGYHLLQSVFVLVDWCDTLHLECRADGQVRRHDLGPALPADDLSLRAARALQQASGCTLGADISVHKHLPWGAGLGGGSSDAASTLLALNRLWGLRWPKQRLQEIALALGGRRAVLRGRAQCLRGGHRRAAARAARRCPAGTGLCHRQTRRSDCHCVDFRQPAVGSRHGSCYSHELSRRHPARSEAWFRIWPQ